MPEIKLKHVVSCSTEDTVSAPGWIYDQCFVHLFLFAFRRQVKVSAAISHHLSGCKIDPQSGQPAELRNLQEVEGGQIRGKADIRHPAGKESVFYSHSLLLF